MKKIFGISILLFVVAFGCYGQKNDSVQFKKIYDKVTEVYKKNIDPYLVDLAKSEIPPLAENANEEAKQIHLAGVDAKLHIHRTNVNLFFSESYVHLSKDLGKVGEYPEVFLSGYFDIGIKKNLPKIDSKFYLKVREEINKM